MNRWERVLLGGTVAAVVLFALAPFLWILLSGFLPAVAILTVPPEWFKYGLILDNYRYIFTGEVPRAYEVGGQLRRMISEEVRAVPRVALNSTLVALGTLALNWILGGPAAYAYARLRFAGKVATFYFVTASRLIPAAALAIPYYLIVKRLGLLDHPLAVVLVHTALTLPFTVLILTLYFRTIPPEIEESAQLDGATRPMILRRVVLPLALPSLVGTGLFAFMLSYGEFLFSLLVMSSPHSRTLPVTLASVSTNPDVSWSLLSAGTTLAVLPALLLVWPIWRYMVRGLVSGAVSG
jgi:ABC-type glycerol-3-phosphate transport system permease component